MITKPFIACPREHERIEDDIKIAINRLLVRLNREATEAYVHTDSYSDKIKVDGLEIKPIGMNVYRNYVVVA